MSDASPRLDVPLRLELPPRGRDVVPFLDAKGLATAAFPWNFEPQRPSVVLVAKATFSLVDGGLAALRGKAEPLSGDEPTEPGGSLRRASDFAPYKPRVDVTLVGHAYAKQGATSSHVTFAFGRLHRRLAVVGDRSWQSGVPTSPAPFERMPLVWERAFGGAATTTNPVGRGAVGGLLPNLEDPDHLVRSPRETPAPVCFAPVSREWAGRQGRLGTYDAAWRRERWPYFPEDFDWGSMNAAPPEQQLEAVRGDEAFELHGVHPTLAAVRGNLPGLVARLFALETRDTGATLREFPARLDTVSFDADAMTVSLVWRGAVHVSSKSAPEFTRFFAMLDPLDEPATLEEAFARLVLDPSVRTSQVGDAPAPRPTSRPAPELLEPIVPREDALALLASGTSLIGMDLSSYDLRGLDLSGRDLRRARLLLARLDDAQLDGANLAGAVLVGAAAPRASLRGANLTGANLARANLAGADLADATLDEASAADLYAEGANFVGASLERTNLSDANLANARLERCRAPFAVLSGADLSNARLDDADLSSAQLYDATAAGSRFERARLVKLRADDADLTGAVLVDADASEASFEGTKLGSSRLTRATLSGAILAHADLTAADLDQATAKGARFRSANLERATLRGANLFESVLEDANLRDADLRQANLYGCNLNGIVRDGARLDGARLGHTLFEPEE